MLFHKKKEENAVEYIHYGTSVFDKTLFKPIINSAYMNKPCGGFWGSPIDSVFGWKKWCEAEQFMDCIEECSVRFRLTKDAKVIYVHSIEDLSKFKNLRRPEGVLDFEMLSKLYDAFYLDLSSDRNHLYSAMYGWDCDSIVVMNPDAVIQIT